MYEPSGHFMYVWPHEGFSNDIRRARNQAQAAHLGATTGLILAILGLALRKPVLDAPIVALYLVLFVLFALTLLAAPDSIFIAPT
jgi:hypothetical protein